jgi:hypothetical protein
MPELFEAAGELLDEAFPHKPGGLVDQHRKREAARQAEIQVQEDADEPIQQRAYKAVKVAPESPESVSGQTFAIGPGQTAMILPSSAFRVSADVLVQPVTGQAPAVTLAKDSGAALGSVGFLLPAGLIKTFRTRGQVWASNATATTVQVSVMSEYYAPAAVS